MGDAFPSDRKQKREALLNDLDKIAPVLQACGAESEELGKLSSEAVTALRTMGMVRVPVTEMMVLEQLAYHDLTSAWCTMVGATGIASLGTFLPQCGLEKVFTDGNVPTATMSFFPAGRAVRERNCFRASDRWRFNGGIYIGGPHQVMSDTAYENHGKFPLGLPADPLS